MTAVADVKIVAAGVFICRTSAEPFKKSIAYLKINGTWILAICKQPLNHMNVKQVCSLITFYM